MIYQNLSTFKILNDLSIKKEIFFTNKRWKNISFDALVKFELPIQKDEKYRFFRNWTGKNRKW